MNIKQSKENLLAALESIDKNKLSLADLKLFAETLKTVSEIQDKGYSEFLTDMIANFSNVQYKPVTVSELKGSEENGL